ncbi:MAG: hypothetical protein GY951_03120 [Psychromonas sp.]|nr:hypothetical protein [Psychromonas sp.]
MSYRFRLLVVLFSVLLISACNEGPSSPNNNATDLTHTYLYAQKTTASPLLEPSSCVDYTRTCSVAELPFIAMSYPNPTIEDIMTRVVVSHDWMGERFEALLSLLPAETLTLLGSVTAVVISDNIRPSFYWTGSGAIYLDPASLWLSNEEKSTIDQTPDYRNAYTSGLSYDFFHRFVKDGQAAYQYYSLTGDQERDIDDILIPVASLLFHELAHANDFMPQDLMDSLILDNPLWSEINRFSNIQLSRQLKQSYPISDRTLKSQAAILYLGQKATDEQKEQSAEYLGSLMEQEGANHLYAYSNQAEDVAMLFQATMLNYYYGIEMDGAFVIQPEVDSPNCSDYIVAWGQRNRIADPISKPRASFVAQQLLPNIDFTHFFNQIDEAQTFPAQTNWCNSSLSRSIESNRDSKNQPTSIIKDHHHGAIIATQ